MASDYHSAGRLSCGSCKSGACTEEHYRRLPVRKGLLVQPGRSGPCADDSLDDVQIATPSMLHRLRRWQRAADILLEMAGAITLAAPGDVATGGGAARKRPIVHLFQGLSNRVKRELAVIG